MTELYNGEIHTFLIQRALLEDKEGAWKAGYTGVFKKEGNCNYWDYKIVDIGEELYGFCFCSLNSVNKYINIDSLYVTPKWRNKRVGSDLIKDIIEYYKNLNIKLIIVPVYEGEQQKFYQKLGFKKSGVVNYGVLRGDKWIKKYQYYLNI